MAPQPLLSRPPLWPSSMLITNTVTKTILCLLILVSGPLHPGPAGYYPNQFHQPRHPRPSFMHHGGGGGPLGGPSYRPPYVVSFFILFNIFSSFSF